jgi:hypothetical protein
MNKLFAAVLMSTSVLMTACANTGSMQAAQAPIITPTATTNGPASEIKGYEGPRIMSQDDVIMNTRNCIDSGMRARVVYMPQRYASGSVDVPVAVNCYPSWNMK